ncbi:MAG TPA: hypothetical protein VLA88_02290 [Candidatus Saccharimonadales bacterium]|nr:hypothetical protein [Candidatus Saccharimonadales bacterium]
MPERMQKLSAPPPADAMVHVPEGTSFYVSSAPPLRVLTDEKAYWDSEFNRADRSGDVFMRRAAESFRDALKFSILGRVAIAAMLTNKMPYDAGLAGSWHASTGVAMSMSRLFRSDPLGLFEDERSLGFVADQTRIGIDFTDEELAKSGIHVRNDLRDELELEPIALGAEEWYEGEEVFVRARARAEPTREFVTRWWQFYGQEHPFRRREFTSYVPRLKSEIWTPDLVQ